MVGDVPKPHAGAFRGSIAHPDLYLWDAWSYVEDDASLHLYTLAVGRKGPDGASLAPQGNPPAKPGDRKVEFSRRDG